MFRLNAAAFCLAVLDASEEQRRDLDARSPLNYEATPHDEKMFEETDKMKLDGGHSIECKLTPATRSPEICFCIL